MKTICGKSAEEIEEFGAKLANKFEGQIILDLLSQVRSLEHQLADPNYLYASGRIHRHAIVIRDEENRDLRAEIDRLKKLLECPEA